MKKREKTALTDFEKLETQDLVEILRTELEKQSPDREVALGILDILQERDANDPTRQDIDVDAMWESYLVRRDALNARTISYTQKEKPRRKSLKVAVAAVLVLALLLAAPPVLGAENILDLVADWTQSIMAVFDPTSATLEQPDEYQFRTENAGLQQLYDKVVELGITQRIVPMWVPEGCVLKELNVTETPAGDKIHARLIDKDSFVIIDYEPYTDETYNKLNKNDGNAKKSEFTGITRTVTRNKDVWIAVWPVDETICMVSTNFDEDTFYRILDSIYEGVD